MIERPVLLKGEMVVATFADIKLETRRLNRLKEINEEPDDWKFNGFWKDAEAKSGVIDPRLKAGFLNISGKKLKPGRMLLIPCDFGKVGDQLWVRETWATKDQIWDDDKAAVFHTSVSIGLETLLYRASGDERPVGNKTRWRPSIFMPRWASRLSLEVTSITVERLQAIDEDGAKREGAELGHRHDGNHIGQSSHREGFILLWDSINDPRGWGWVKNPWVWVVKFKRVINGKP